MKARSKTVLSILLLLMLAFIWGNSLLDPEKSWAISNAVQQILSHFTPVAESEMTISLWGAIIRKLAHFSEFFVFGVLLLLRLYKGGGHIPCETFLFGVLTALTDETIQFYTGRTSSVFDVWLDIAGAVCGITAAFFLCSYCTGRKKRMRKGHR